MKSSTESRPRGVLRMASTILLAALAAPAFSTLVATSSEQGISTKPAASKDGPNAVLARVGDHAVTQGEVDGKVAAQLYDLRKQALDEIIDDYVVQKAAKKAGLKPDQYIKQQLKSSTPSVTAQEAEQFYSQHKAQLEQQTGTHSFQEIKPRLLAAMQRQRDQEAQQQLIQKLRAESHVSLLMQAPRVTIASAGHPSAGGVAAPVTIIEFSDFQCPFCRAAENSIKQVRQQYGDQVKLVYMDFPLSFHPHAMDAARAARCAADQGKFWSFHDALFLDQKKLDADGLKKTAVQVGLDQKQFNACFTSDKHDTDIRSDLAQGNSLGVTGTPTFFINGRELVGAQPPPKFNELIDEELARAKQPLNSRQAMR